MLEHQPQDQIDCLHSLPYDQNAKEHGSLHIVCARPAILGKSLSVLSQVWQLKREIGAKLASLAAKLFSLLEQYQVTQPLKDQAERTGRAICDGPRDTTEIKMTHLCQILGYMACTCYAEKSLSI